MSIGQRFLTDPSLSTSVPVEDGETALRAWDASYRGAGAAADGILYLTDRRLVWIRGRLSSAEAPRTIEIALDEIKRCYIPRRMLRWWPRWRTLVVAGVGGIQYEYRLPLWKANESIIEDIRAAMRERGLVK